jgi:hypothetical protein
MNALRIVAIVLIVAGVLGLAYGGFSYVKESHDVKLGPIEFTANERETVQVPLWASIASIAAGTLLLLKRQAS